MALAAERVFARDGLAEYLRERGVPYEPFDTLAEIAAAARRAVTGLSLSLLSDPSRRARPW